MTKSAGMKDYSNMSHSGINSFYNELRKDDPDKALSEGLLMHKAIHPKLYGESSDNSTPINSDPVNPGKVSTGSVQAEPTAYQPLYMGDSLAVGLGGENNPYGKVGRNAFDNLTYLKKQGSDFYDNRDIVLSSGILNGGTMANVREQLRHLQEQGAKSIKLVGAPKYNTRFAGYNDKLRAIADEYGIEFNGGYDARHTDGVHPTYSDHPYVLK